MGHTLGKSTFSTKYVESPSLRIVLLYDIVRHIHVEIHKCQICGKSFRQNDLTTRHSQIHTGERHCKCIVYNKSFTQPGDLRRHNHIRTGEDIKNSLHMISHLSEVEILSGTSRYTPRKNTGLYFLQKKSFTASYILRKLQRKQH